MAFEWTPISVGDIIKKSHIEEIRSNIDSIVNNLACITHKSSYCTSYNSAVDNDLHGTYKSGDRSGYDSSYNSTVQDGYQAYDFPLANSVNVYGDRRTVYSGEKSYYKVSFCGAVT